MILLSNVESRLLLTFPLCRPASNLIKKELRRLRYVQLLGKASRVPISPTPPALRESIPWSSRKYHQTCISLERNDRSYYESLWNVNISINFNDLLYASDHFVNRFCKYWKQISHIQLLQSTIVSGLKYILRWHHDTEESSPAQQYVKRRASVIGILDPETQRITPSSTVHIVELRWKLNATTNGVTHLAAFHVYCQTHSVMVITTALLL